MTPLHLCPDFSVYDFPPTKTDPCSVEADARNFIGSSDEQTSLSHTSAEAQKKETAFDHHVEALRAQSKKNTLHHEHEVNAEEVATEKKFINLIPHRPAVFNSQSEAAQVRLH